MVKSNTDLDIITTTNGQKFRLERQQKLGEGAQGEVILGTDLATSKSVAIKIQHPPHGMSVEEDVKRERRNLELDKRLIGIADIGIGDNKTSYTVMDYCPGIDLVCFLYHINPHVEKEEITRFIGKRKLDDIQKLRLAKLALQELIHLHEVAGLAHRDIKSTNFVLDIRGQSMLWRKLALIDVGSGIIAATEKDKTIAGSFGYIAPEFAENISPQDRPYYDFRCDYFSLGVVFAEIFTEYNYQALLISKLQVLKALNDHRPLTATEIKSMMPDIFSHAIHQDDNDVMATVIALIKRLTAQSPEARPNLDELKAALQTLKGIECKLSIEGFSLSPRHSVRAPSPQIATSTSDASIPRSPSITSGLFASLRSSPRTSEEGARPPSPVPPASPREVTIAASAVSTDNTREEITNSASLQDLRSKTRRPRVTSFLSPRASVRLPPQASLGLTQSASDPVLTKKS